MPAAAYTLAAAAAAMSAPTSLRMSWLAKVDSPSLVMAWAAMTTRRSRPWRRTKSSLQMMAAAAPQVGGQHCSRVSGSNTVGEASTSSSVTVWRNTASGLRAACWRALTDMRAKVLGAMPNCRM